VPTPMPRAGARRRGRGDGSGEGHIARTAAAAAAVGGTSSSGLPQLRLFYLAEHGAARLLSRPLRTTATLLLGLLGVAAANLFLRH
jgi:hypothetical protein